MFGKNKQGNTPDKNQPKDAAVNTNKDGAAATPEQALAAEKARIQALTPEELLAYALQAAESLATAAEDLANAETIIEQQNESIEQMDAKAGTETGNFIEHKKQKLEVRLKRFKIQGKEYGLDDLKKNVSLTIKGRDKDGKPENKEIGLTDYLLSIKSSILEIEND